MYDVLSTFSDRYSSGSRHREHGRTFYNRQTQQPAFKSTFTSIMASKTSTRDFLLDNIDLDYDGTWHVNGRIYNGFDKNVPFDSNQHSQNGLRRGDRGSRLHAYNYCRQQGKGTSTDVADDDSDQWPTPSTESTSVCSNSSFTSDVVPLSPNRVEGLCLFSICLFV